MVKCGVCVRLIVSVVITLSCSTANEPCESSCIEAAKCQFFGDLKKEDQLQWLDRYQCDGSADTVSKSVYGFSSSAKGDVVCCPENVWQVDNSAADLQKREETESSITNNSPEIEKHSYYDYPNKRGGNRYPSPSYPNANQYPNSNQYGGQDNRYGYDDETTMYENTRIWQNRNRIRPQTNAQNRIFNIKPIEPQCQLTSFPPEASTGCCGEEAKDDRKAANQYPNSEPNSYRYSQYSDDSRKKRAVGNNVPVKVEIDTRIAGGQQTEFYQYPWTTLLKTTFKLIDKESTFSCGGSLISSVFILTAGHCIYDSRGTVKGVEVYLAEYDKTTFPMDCKMVLGSGRQCIENIVMQALQVYLHPEYDDSYLHNDIGLVKLQGKAPYTDYIRPICLPPLNVDNPDLSHLRLAVAGWGRNGQTRTDIKQSTIVNLVPNEDCAASYPGLTAKQLCAAGYTGEDTCKGDSGGPLMMMYGGKFYLSGIVSGKRADAPCGTSVPSLYTNVFMYISWIRNVIKINS